MVEDAYKGKKIFVAINASEKVHADMAMSLLALSNHSTNVGIEMMFNCESLPPMQARSLQVFKALKKKATHILFLDSDIKFPPWLLERQLERAESCKKEVLGVTLPSTNAPYFQDAKDLKGERLHIDVGDERGLERVSEIGLSATLVNMTVFEKINFPWFSSASCFQKKEKQEEDLENKVRLYINDAMGFCKSAKDVGIKLYVDIPLSMDVQRFGSVKFDYTSKDFFNDAVELRRQKAQHIIAETIEANKDKTLNKKDGKVIMKVPKEKIANVR